MAQHRSCVKTGTPPAAVVTWQDMQAHSRIDGDDEKALVEQYIKEAENRVNGMTNSTIAEQEWTARYADFPLGEDGVTRDGTIFLPVGGCIDTEEAPPTITYVSSDSEVVPLTSFQFDPYKGIAEIKPAPGETWPETMTGGLNNVKIVFKTKHPDPEVEGLVRLLVAFWYELRVPVSPDDVVPMGSPGGFENMVMNLRIGG